MKKIASIVLFLFSVLLSVTFSKAQAATDWMRITSDNGEFSAEVPQVYDFFYDEKGFELSKDQSHYTLKNVHIFSSFRENTLISFECYETAKGGSDALLGTDSIVGKITEEKLDSIKFKQIANSTDSYYILRRYYRSKNHLYVLPAASRGTETAAMKRFFNSIVFKPDLPATKTKINFSSLKISNIEIEMKEDLNYKALILNSTLPDDPSIKKIHILSKPRVHYVDDARMRGIQGTIALQTTLNERGFIPKFRVLKSLPQGLLRQTIFSALRIKFLPQEKNDMPETIVKIIEYNFTLY